MKKTLSILLLPVLATLALGGCSVADDDRESGNGKDPDVIHDTSHVTLYRNANNIPNVAYFCAGELGWASTLSGTDQVYKAAFIVRLPEYDAVCSETAVE